MDGARPSLKSRAPASEDSLVQVSSIAATGIRAASRSVEVAANNLANVSTPGYRPSRTVAAALAEGGVATTTQLDPAAIPPILDGEPGSGTDIATELVRTMTGARAYEASLAVLSTGFEMDRQLLSITR